MSKGLRVEIEDEITGFCPACHTPHPQLVYDTGGGSNSKYELMKYRLRCQFQGVCRLRYDYMREDA